MHIPKIVMACVALIACSPEGTASGDAAKASHKGKPAPQQDLVREGAKIWGSWSIVSITGVPLVTTKAGTGKSFPLRVSFTPDGYGFNVGCNDFGGHGLFRAGRYHTAMAEGTAMFCDDVNAQEAAVAGILGNNGPLISVSPDKNMIVTNKNMTMVLAPATPTEAERTQIAAGAKPINLIGTVWGIDYIDGTLGDVSPRRTQTQFLKFEDDYWTATLACGTVTGGWRAQGERIDMVGDVTTETKTCKPEEATRDAKFLALMKGKPSFGACCFSQNRDQDSSPNYDVAHAMMAASDDHMMTLGRGASLVDEAQLLSGNWSIIAIDGDKPLSATAPKLSYSSNSYTGNTGCNSITGYFLAHNRFFFAVAGPQTEMGCSGALGAQENRITALLSSRPAVARTRSGNVVLMDAKGHLELARDAANVGVPVSRDVRSAINSPLDLQLLAFNGVNLPQTVVGARPTLAFTNSKWRARLGCGEPTGNWRLKDDRFSGFADGAPYGAPPCPPQNGKLNEQLNRLIDGQARILIADGDFLLARHDHWLTARLKSK